MPTGRGVVVEVVGGGGGGRVLVLVLVPSALLGVQVVSEEALPGASDLNGRSGLLNSTRLTHRNPDSKTQEQPQDTR